MSEAIQVLWPWALGVIVMPLMKRTRFLKIKKTRSKVFIPDPPASKLHFGFQAPRPWLPLPPACPLPSPALRYVFRFKALGYEVGS